MRQLDPRAFVESLDLRSGGRRLVAAMIASADGRATVADRSVGLGHPADRALLRELRTAVDVILVGTGTLAAERYATLLDDDQRDRRRAAGLSPHPAVVTISRSLSVPDVPLLHEPDVPFVVYTESPGEGPGEVRRLDRATVAAVVDDLGDAAILCEGGPRLLRAALAAGCVSDLLLTVAPLLTAGDAPAITAGEAFDEPLALELHEARRADDHLLLWYRTR